MGKKHVFIFVYYACSVYVSVYVYVCKVLIEYGVYMVFMTIIMNMMFHCKKKNDCHFVRLADFGFWSWFCIRQCLNLKRCPHSYIIAILHCKRFCVPSVNRCRKKTEFTIQISCWIWANETATMRETSPNTQFGNWLISCILYILLLWYS